MSTVKRKTMHDFEEMKKQQDDSFLQMNLKPATHLNFEVADRPVVAKK